LKFEDDAMLDRRLRINNYGTVAVLLMLLLVMNPELRAFLLVTNFIGVDLMIFLIAIQLRYALPAIPRCPHQMRSFLCAASLTTIRVTIRMIALLLVPSRISVGLTTLLCVVSRDRWCPKPRSSASV
jgi:hypothetical protein